MPEGLPGIDSGGIRQLTQALTTEGLTQLEEDGRATPRLAHAWSWEQPWTRLRLSLEPGIMAHDGLAVTAERVAEALDRKSTRLNSSHT